MATFTLVLLLIAITTISASRPIPQRPAIPNRPPFNRPTAPPTTPTTTLTARDKCRGEFDCKAPTECYRGFCREVEAHCTWPGKPPFGSLRPDEVQYKIGARVEYFCNPGYRMMGERFTNCTGEGHWVPRHKPQCVATRCANPGRPYRGIIVPDKQWYEMGEVVTAQCKSAYRLRGESKVRCVADGTWSTDLPVCDTPMTP